MIKIMAAEFKQYGYKFPSFVAGSTLLKIVSWFDKEVKAIVPMAGRSIKIGNQPSIE